MGDHPVIHFDVSGPDNEQLQSFYGDLFGWSINPVPEMNYALVDTQGGEGINGGIGKPPEGPGFTAFYVGCDDVQETLDKAASLGAKVTQPTMTIPRTVTLAMFADPAGNEIGLVGTPPDADPNLQPAAVSPGSGAPVVWFEVQGPDAEALVNFYSQLFGWSGRKYDMPGEFAYYEMDTATDRGIRGGIGNMAQGNSYATVYAKPADIDAAVQKATELGAQIIMPATAMPDGSRVAMFLDPQGHIFGMHRPAS